MLNSDDTPLKQPDWMVDEPVWLQNASERAKKRAMEAQIETTARQCEAGAFGKGKTPFGDRKIRESEIRLPEEKDVQKAIKFEKQAKEKPRNDK